MTMPKAAAKLIADLENRVSSLERKPRLMNSSVDGAGLPFIDDDGVVRTVTGRQADGSYGTLVRSSPPQPTPTKLRLTAGELGAVECTWDGGTTDFDKPLVHGHLVIETCYAGEDGSTPGEWRKAGTIRDRDGGATTIVCSTPGVWMVRCFLVGQDRVTRGDASEVETVQVEALVDTAEIEQELEEARQERQEYRDAFDERTTEYDRLMGEHEDALAETDAWGHTAVYRADQAAAEAAAARETADRAEDNAAAARETADGSLELQHITEPEGTGSVHGQRWVQYDTMGRDRKILGVWTWNDEDKTWDRVSHDVTYLPMADITQATIGDLEAQRIFAELGEIGDLAVDQITGDEARVNQLFTDTTVATSVWSQIVRTRLLEADEALIGGALIQNNAITVDKIAVTDELIFEIARGISLEVGQLASNDIVGMNIRGGLIDGSVITGGEFETERSGSITTRIARDTKHWRELRVNPGGVEEVSKSAVVPHMSFYDTDVAGSPGIFRDGARMVLFGGDYTAPVGYEDSSLGEVVVSGSRLVAPRTSSGHTHAESLHVTQDGLVGEHRLLELSGWHTNRAAGEYPHVVQMGRLVVIGGAVGLETFGRPTSERDPWGDASRYIRGFPPPDVPKRFNIPIITNGGRLDVTLPFEIDITGTGRFMGGANDYRSAFTGHFDGLTYVTSIQGAGASSGRNLLPDPQIFNLEDPELYYAPGPWADSVGSAIDSPGGGHNWSRTLDTNNGTPQLTLTNRSSGLHRIALRYRKGEGIEVNRGQRVTVFFRYWNPDDSFFAFRPFFFDAETGDPLTGANDFDPPLQRVGIRVVDVRNCGPRWLWSLLRGAHLPGAS